MLHLFANSLEFIYFTNLQNAVKIVQFVLLIYLLFIILASILLLLTSKRKELLLPIVKKLANQFNSMPGCESVIPLKKCLNLTSSVWFFTKRTICLMLKSQMR